MAYYCPMENGKAWCILWFCEDQGNHPRPFLFTVSKVVKSKGLCWNIGLANDTINKKRSKSMDMRFFRLRDRVAQQQFVVEHIPGQHNVADFFTKALPKSKYDQFHRYRVVNRDCMEEKRG